MSRRRKFPYQSFRWTSRAEACAELYRFVLETPPGDSYDAPSNPTHRVCAGELLALLDPTSPFRIALIRRKGEERWLKRVALQALLHSEAEISPEDLLLLLEQERHLPHTAQLLHLCRSDELIQTACDWIEGKSIEERAALLSAIHETTLQAWGWPRWCEQRRQPPGAVVDLLYWGCFGSGSPLTTAVDQPLAESAVSAAALTADRSEARMLLTRHLADTTAWRCKGMMRLISHHPECLQGLLSIAPPSLADFPIAALGSAFSGVQPALAARALIEHYGTDELLLELEARLRRGGNDGETFRQLGGVRLILTELPEPEADDFITSLLACPDIGGNAKRSLRAALWERFWKYHREQAAARLHEDLDRPGWNQSQIEDAFHPVATAPCEADRPFLWWSTEQDDHPRYAFAGIVGFENLGVDGDAWRTSLRQLTTSTDMASRLLACAALVRRGETAFLAPLEQSARTFPESVRDHATDHEQGLALRLLGELDPHRYFGLLQAVLLQRLPEDHNGSPEQEAAFVMAGLATPEAVTMLFRAYFIAPDYLRRVLRRYLPAAVARLEGREAPLVNQIDLWRYARIPP